MTRIPFTLAELIGAAALLAMAYGLIAISGGLQDFLTGAPL